MPVFINVLDALCGVNTRQIHEKSKVCFQCPSSYLCPFATLPFSGTQIAKNLIFFSLNFRYVELD